MTHNADARFHLYKTLKDAGFPQGGAGAFMIHPETDERVYIARPEEIYAQYLADPKGWEMLTDFMAKAWIENKTGKPFHQPNLTPELVGEILEEVVITQHKKKGRKKSK